MEELWNLSDKTASWLREAGISSYGELARADLLELWAGLKTQHRQVTRLMYYALVGAKLNCHWKEIPQQERDRIDAFIEATK